MVTKGFLQIFFIQSPKGFSIESGPDQNTFSPKILFLPVIRSMSAFEHKNIDYTFLP